MGKGNGWDGYERGQGWRAGSLPAPPRLVVGSCQLGMTYASRRNNNYYNSYRLHNEVPRIALLVQIEDSRAPPARRPSS